MGSRLKLCSWQGPFPLRGISSPQQGSPSHASKTPDTRASETQNTRKMPLCPWAGQLQAPNLGESSGFRFLLPSPPPASTRPTSHPVSHRGDLSLPHLIQVTVVATSPASWDSLVEMEGDRVCWGLGGTFCSASSVW